MPEQPRARHLPVPRDRRSRDADRAGNLVFRHAGEVPKFDDASLALIDVLEFVEGRMKREHLTGDGFHPANLIVEGNAEGVRGTLHGVSAPRMVHEDSAHHFGGDGQEVRAVLPIDSILVDQPQVGFVNERGRLQGVVAPFPTQIACRARPQISVNQMEEIVARLDVPTSPGA